LRRRSADVAVNAISVNVADELVERIARRAAELVAAQSSEPVDDGWLRGAQRIASYIDAPRSRVYALASAKRIPVHRDGSALIARRSELDKWLLRGGGRRP
jgi:excisionase family DNA binding protein